MKSVYMDICGPMSTVSYGGGQYFLLLVKAASRYSRAVIISDRSSPLVVKETMSFIGAIERANGKYKAKKVLSDNALEFRSSQLIDEFNKKGIQKVYTCSYTPQSNGIVEKMNHTVMNHVRTLICHSKLPKEL
jgi:transposase InsO family protein